MLIEEITRTQVDEGVKDWIAKAALATSLMLAPSAEAQPKPTSKSTSSATTASKTMSKPMLDHLMVLKADTPQQREQLFKTMASNAGIKGVELSALLAQSSHETGRFKWLRELEDPKRFHRYETVKAEELGNVKPGDGERYRGRGFLQITGRANYRWVGKMLGLDLESNPQIVEKPGIAAAASLIYWQERVKSNVKDFKNVEQVTKKINPNQKGLTNRKKEFKKYSQPSKKTQKNTPKKKSKKK